MATAALTRRDRTVEPRERSTYSYPLISSGVHWEGLQWTGDFTSIDLVAATTIALNGALLARRPDHCKQFTLSGRVGFGGHRSQEPRPSWGTLRVLTFAGKNSVTPGREEVFSDPVSLGVHAGQDLAISLFLPDVTGLATYHLGVAISGRVRSAW